MPHFIAYLALSDAVLARPWPFQLPHCGTARANAALEVTDSALAPGTSNSATSTRQCSGPLPAIDGRADPRASRGGSSSPKRMSSAQLLVGVLFSNGVLLFSNFVLEHKSNPFENKTATNNWAELIRFGDENGSLVSLGS